MCSKSAFTACIVCRRAHTACDAGRPCQRCIKMNKEDQCQTPLPRKRGRKRNDEEIYDDELDLVNPAGTSKKSKFSLWSSDGPTNIFDRESDPPDAASAAALSLLLSEIKRLAEGQQRLQNTIMELQKEKEQHQCMQDDNVETDQSFAAAFAANAGCSQMLVDDAKPFAMVAGSHFVAANQEFCKLLEYSLDELKTLSSPRKILHPTEIYVVLSRLLNHILQSSKTMEVPAMTFQTKSGKTFLASVVTQFFYNDKTFPSFMMLQITHVFDPDLSSLPPNAGIEASAAIPCESVQAGWQQLPKLLNLINDVQEIKASEQPFGGHHDYDSMLSLIQRKIETLSCEHSGQDSPRSDLESPRSEIPETSQELGVMSMIKEEELLDLLPEDEGEWKVEDVEEDWKRRSDDWSAGGLEGDLMMPGGWTDGLLSSQFV